MNIVIAGHFLFPVGSASASRMRHMAQGLIECGHTVHVLSLVPSHVLPEDAKKGDWYNHQGIAYHLAAGCTPRQDRRTLTQKLKVQYHALYQSQVEAIKRIEELHATIGVDVLIGYSLGHIGMQRILRFCQSHGIFVVRDVVEWLRHYCYPWGWLDPFYWNTWLIQRVSLPKSDGIIAISQYIANLFDHRGMKVVRIPAIIDPDNWHWDGLEPEHSASASFQLTYLGDMNKRDRPLLMIRAIRRVLEQGYDAFFNIVGSDGRVGLARQARELAESDSLLADHVKFWGRVSDEDLRRHLFASDALLFCRWACPTAQAAFPTRLPEFLMTGKPVISSDVSDIAEYLKDGEEIIVVKPDSVEALAEGIIKLEQLPDQGRSIGEAGRRKCIECFDYRMRCRQISEFLTDLVSQRETSHDARQGL